MSTIPSSTPSDGFASLGETKGGLPRSVNIPTNIKQQNMLSGTSWSDDCYIYQKFAEKLQAYLIGYTNAIYSQYSIYQ